MSFQQAMSALTAHIRDPETVSGPTDVEDRRLKIYRELFYNNIEGFVSGAFPVLRSLINDAAWHAMIRDFMRQHQCKTPYFLEISQEFQHYLASGPELLLQPEYPIFIQELAHYEWVELALDVDEQDLQLFISDTRVDSEGDLLDQLPVMSPLAWSLAYQYPVHLIGEDFQPESPSEQPNCLVVYRNFEHKVEFLEANPVTARLLALISSAETGVNGRSLLLQLAEELQYPDPEQLLEGGLTLLQQLRGLGIILGTCSP